MANDPSARAAGQAFCRHDHAGCAAQVLARAEALSREAGLRLTPVRRRVLEILLEEHRALGAYEVLDRLGAEGFGSQPPVAYRALDFLVANGLAHRVRRLNAFTACMRPGEVHQPAFFICEGCGHVAEAAAGAIGAEIAAAAAALGFAPSRASVEIAGTCPGCAGEGAP